MDQKDRERADKQLNVAMLLFFSSLVAFFCIVLSESALLDLAFLLMGLVNMYAVKKIMEL